jgi:hypothetical protein
MQYQFRVDRVLANDGSAAWVLCGVGPLDGDRAQLAVWWPGEGWVPAAPLFMCGLEMALPLASLPEPSKGGVVRMPFGSENVIRRVFDRMRARVVGWKFRNWLGAPPPERVAAPPFRELVEATELTRRAVLRQEDCEAFVQHVKGQDWAGLGWLTLADVRFEPFPDEPGEPRRVVAVLSYKPLVEARPGV